MMHYIRFIATGWREPSLVFIWAAHLTLLGVVVGYIALLLVGALHTAH
jgi:hypothetical protein